MIQEYQFKQTQEEQQNIISNHNHKPHKSLNQSIQKNQNLPKFHPDNIIPMMQQSQSSPNLFTTIDQILDHHYFQSRIRQLIQQHSSTNSTLPSLSGILDDQYYKAEEDITGELVDLLVGAGHREIQQVLVQELKDVGKQVENIKRDLLVWMTEQDNKAAHWRKQVDTLVDELKRKVNTGAVMGTGSVGNSGGFVGGIRVIRSGNIGTTQIGGLGVNLEGKSFHSEFVALKKEIEELREGIEKSQSLRILQQNFNDFKIQTKVGMQSLKQQYKKHSIQLQTSIKTLQHQIQSQSTKQAIESSIKRIIGSQLKVYGSYSQQIIDMRAEMEKFGEKLESQSQMHKEYLINQLKSVWLILNDTKLKVDQMVDSQGGDFQGGQII